MSLRSRSSDLVRWLTTSAFGVSIVCALAFGWLWVLNRGTVTTLDFGNRATPWVLTGSGLIFSTVGWFISSRRPGNAVGWVAVAIGGTAVIGTAANEWAILATLTRPGELAGGELAGWLGNFIWLLTVGLLSAVLVLLFPDGRLQSRRWQPVMIASVAGMVAALIYFALAPGPLESLQWIDNPFGVEDARPWIEYLAFGFFVLAAMVPLAAWSMRRRYRSADSTGKAQIRWFASAAALVALTYVGQFAYSVITGTLDGGSDAQRWFQTAAVAAFGALGASVGVAVLHYRLYEIDRIISRTVTYALVIGLLGAVALVLVGGMTTVLPNNDPVVVAVATLSVAALFSPVHRRVHEMVDRRFNRPHFDAARVMDQFAFELRERLDPEQVVADWVGVVQSTMHPAFLGVWVRSP